MIMKLLQNHMWINFIKKMEDLVEMQDQNFFDESNGLVKNIQNNDFNDNEITNVKSIEINENPTNDNHVLNKKYVGDNFILKTDTSIVKSNENNNFNDNEITKVKKIDINENPTNDNHVSIKKYVDDSLDENTNVRLNSNSNENHLQVRVQNAAFNLQIYNKAQMIDTTTINYPNTGGYLLQKWKIECNNKNGDGKIFFDSFGGNPDKLLLHQLPKPIISHNYKIQNIDSMLCGSYCFLFFLFSGKDEL